MSTQDRVLTAITDYWRENAIPPTIRAVQMRTGINSTSQIRIHFLSLEKQGLIKRIRSKPVPTHIYQLITQGESSR